MARGKRGPRPPKGPLPQHLRKRNLTHENNNPAFHGYTLAEEARNTAQNRRGYAVPNGLRYRPVTFVSAGFMDPLKDLEVSQQAAMQSATKSESEPRFLDATQVATSDNVTTTPTPNPPATNEPASQVLTDTTNRNWSTSTNNQHQDHESDLDWDSTGEVILFKGRQGRRQPPPRDATTKTTNEEGGSTDLMHLHEVERELRAVHKTIKNETPQDPADEPTDFISFDTPKPRNRRGSRKPNRTIKADKDDEEAAIIADYIANMQDNGEDEEDENDDDDVEDNHPGIGSHAFHVLRDLGGTDSEAIPDAASSEDESEGGTGDEFNQRRQLESEDERMARMLAKQEELGLDSDDFNELLNGAGSTDEWFTAPETAPRRKKGASKKAKILQKAGEYPSATQMADAFDELDLMDWHRPSLNNFKKGSRPFNISDSELEEAMNMTWKKDRLKKAEKKKAREELRSQGLLGKNVNPDDLRVKYQGGMSLDDLANEMEAFMLGSQEQLILPPFDKSARKIVHFVANRLKIKSQSAGKGIARYPVLYRTKGTLPFDQVVFDRTFSHIRQTWFPRVDVDERIVNETRVLKRAEARSGNTRWKNLHILKDGDIVGQHATEIGAENKGRAMLEKMGWSKGMALGSEENKGIMVPIPHVFKKTKAGLGDA